MLAGVTKRYSLLFTDGDLISRNHSEGFIKGLRFILKVT